MTTSTQPTQCDISNQNYTPKCDVIVLYEKWLQKYDIQPGLQMTQ